MNYAEELKKINEFEAHYKYDSTYMRELLETSPEGYAKFDNLIPLASHREILDPEVYWVAKLAAVQAEDCGHCLQLNVRMALEYGVSKQIVEATIKGGSDLPGELNNVFLFATDVASNTLSDTDLAARIEAQFDKGALLELGLCIATAKMFPTIKRAVGYTKSCSLMSIEV